MRRRPEHLVNPFAQTSQQLLLAFRELNHVPLRLTLGNPRQALFKQHFPPGPRTFNREGWEHILNEHGGVLPITIKAVPEGMVVPTKNVLMSPLRREPFEEINKI